jgi:hypothetical protein
MRDDGRNAAPPAAAPVQLPPLPRPRADDIFLWCAGVLRKRVDASPQRAPVTPPEKPSTAPAGELSPCALCGSRAPSEGRRRIGVMLASIPVCSEKCWAAWVKDF